MFLGKTPEGFEVLASCLAVLSLVCSPLLYVIHPTMKRNPLCTYDGLYVQCF